MKLIYVLLTSFVVLAGCVDTSTSALSVAQADPTLADKDVAWNEARVARDPKGAIGWSQLSAAYLHEARLHDSNEYAQKAESAAKTSLSIRPYRNQNARLRLAQSVLEQHRFSDALRISEEASAASAGTAVGTTDVDPPSAQLHAEIMTELGNYDEAWKELKSIRSTGLGVMVLKARLDEVDGNTAEAESLLKGVSKLASSNWDMSPESKSWYHQKYGTLLWNEGKLDEACVELTSAVTVNPLDFKSMGLLARLLAGRGDMEGAKTWGSKSLEITPTVEVAALMEDIEHASGGKKEVIYQTMVDKLSHPEMYRFLADPSRATTGEKPHTHDRLYAMYLADHHRNLQDALAAARLDLAARQDVYAFETMAWVLHQLGQDTEAKQAIEKALSRGTLDAKMLYHAGEIDLALGNRPLAKQELAQALKLNSAFQYPQNQKAKADLETIQ